MRRLHHQAIALLNCLTLPVFTKQMEDPLFSALTIADAPRFLWVDYQLRELCKLCLESDIRARLGKLPRNLSGVYDEIMNSIESRPGTDFELATRALKWMLVSRKPLKPQELVAATGINPSSTPLDRPADDQLLHPAPDLSLDIELVVHVCGGLILLDHELEVIRFAHLSVQEYLETRQDSWGIIDAQRFVSEGCLWTLQCGPCLTSALYDYAGCNWFRHCRSYQDIILSRRTQDPNNSLDIPILNTFLGSFACGSTHFTEWVDWLKEQKVQKVYEDLHPCYWGLSKPLSPAFAAATSGLGELISWLWHSESADMNIRTDENKSLLYLASSYGTTWIMECVLARGVELDINEVCSSGTALCGAAESGMLENATLLLDQGADPNIAYGGSNVTALFCAIAGGKLEIVMLLLGRGADINVVFGSSLGSTLALATFLRRREMATLLLDHGTDINIRFGGEYGTALGVAAAFGRLELATLLLDRGANPDLTNSLGQKPRDIVEHEMHHEMVSLLDSYSTDKTENQTTHTQASAGGSKDG